MNKRDVLVGVTCLLPGCSFLYSTSELQLLDAAPDAEVVIDAAPLDLALERVEPAELVEGQGIDGSRSAILLIHGTNLVQPNTTVTLVPSGPAPTQSPVVDSANLVVDKYFQRLAVPVSLPVDETLGAGQTVVFDVVVTHDEGGTIVSQTLPGAVTLDGLDELAAAPAAGLTGGIHTYSRINITSGSLAAAAGQTAPIRLQSTSSITIAVAISVAAGAPPTAGPGGGAGGAGGAGGLATPGPGKTGDGPAPGMTNGAPAGFVGDNVLATLGGNNRSSGGAGGNGMDVTELGTDGGDGGGGGGSIELVAAGDLSLMNVSARGAAGAAPSNANPGGAGSGGMILLRSGRNLAAGTLDVSGGLPGGAAGRARVDASGTLTVTSALPTAAYRGPALVAVPLIVTAARPMLRAVGSNDAELGYFFTQGGASTGVLTEQLGTGPTDFAPSEPLYEGFNKLCLLVPGATRDSDTRSCIDLVYLPSL
jgi:hypothetical protein